MWCKIPGKAVLCAVVLYFLPFLTDVSAFQRADTLQKYQKADYSHFSASDAKEGLTEAYEKVINFKRTGDPENDFAFMMIEYNSGIQSLIEYQIEKGTDSRMVSLARQTLSRHNDVMEILKTYLGKVKPAKGRKSPGGEVTGSMRQKFPETIEENIDKIRTLDLSGNPDEDFASVFFYHCMGAISIIDDYLDNGKDEILIKIALRMREENQASAEITVRK